MIKGKNGDVIIDEVDVYNKTMTVSSIQGFYIRPEASSSVLVVDNIGYMYTSNQFYFGFDPSNFYLYTSSAYNYKPPTLEEKIAEQIQMGYQEVVPKWYVHQNEGQIRHLCEQEEVQGYPPDFHEALILNKNWHNHNVICSKCHQPAPSKVFFLSEAVK